MRHSKISVEVQDYHTEGVLNTTPPSSSSLVPDAEEASYMNQFRTKIYGCSS